MSKKSNDSSNKKKFSLFGIFGPKSVTKDDEFAEIPTNLKGFFVMFKRKFWNISNLSLVYSLVNLPLLFVFLAFSFQDQVAVNSNPMSAPFFGFWQVSQSADLAAVHPFTNGISYVNVMSTTSWVLLGISALFIFTFGLANVGAAYCVRGYNRGDPVFLMSDFFGAIKRNWKQGMVVGIIDLIISFLLIYDYMFWQNQPGFFNAILMYFALFLIVLYFMMRFYIYTLIVTFDLKISKIFKNSLLMAFLGFKRNFLALIGIIAVLVISIWLLTVYIPVGIMLPLILTIGLLMFIAGYASYPVIKKYMILPFYPDYDKRPSDDDFEDDEPVFEDRG